MRKLDFPTLIKEELNELQKRERQETTARLRLRVQFLRLLKTEQVASIKAASQSIGITAKRGYQWWALYKEKELDGYLQLNYKARQVRLSQEQQAKLVKRSSEGNGFGSQREAIKYLHEEFALSYTQPGVCLLFQRLKIKAKEPRPENKKADKEAQTEYKKNFAGRVDLKPYYFQDEMRFGTRTELGRRWTASGVRPRGEMLIGYEYGYLSAALNPQTGEMFCLLLPDMRVESFQAFVDEFVKFVGEQQQQQSQAVRLITDGASAHRSRRLKICKQLEIEHLPPYSPELNPVERLFKELRQQLKNRVFESLEAVEEAVIEAVKPYLSDGVRVRKLTFYGWLRNTPT